MNTTIQNISGADDVHQTDYGGIIIKMTIICIQIFVFVIGSYIQIKIVLTCLRTKFATTWRLDIANAVAWVILVFFIIIQSLITTDQLSLLHQYIGTWICYPGTIIYIYVTYLVFFHSFVVSLMKYIFIVHHLKTREFGKEKMQKVFFMVNIIHPLVLAILTTLAYDFEANEHIVTCFGLKEQMLEVYNTSSGALEKTFLCKLGRMGNEDEALPWFYIKQSFCAVKMIWVLVLSTNIPEAYLYFKVFRTMRR